MNVVNTNCKFECLINLYILEVINLQQLKQMPITWGLSNVVHAIPKQFDTTTRCSTRHNLTPTPTPTFGDGTPKSSSRKQKQCEINSLMDFVKDFNNEHLA